MKSNFIFLLIIFLFPIAGCDAEKPSEKKGIPKPEVVAPVQLTGCKKCHQDVSPDEYHSLDCSNCHQGNQQGATIAEAHQNLITKPAHPANMEKTCGSCHPQQVKEAEADLHFTLTNKINLVRNHFGATKKLSSLTLIPQHKNITTSLELADDMLRKRCLRCHVYSSGDDYPYVSRGTGCGSCHLSFYNGALQSHSFKKPTDRQCLSCHYGNYVGSDYYGKFENDYNWEYRTPYVTRKPFLRPYGVEQLNLAPDIHQQKGLVCVDCHRRSGHGNNKKVSCSSCHRAEATSPPFPLVQRDQETNTFFLTGKKSLKKHIIPQLQHPAHAEYGNQVACQACHAQWSYNDGSTHLLRSELDVYDPWERLTVQGSSEVEFLLEHNLYSDEDEIVPGMSDGITVTFSPGIWYKGFSQRRWENMLIHKDNDGIIKVFRPILDLNLSMITNEEEVIFDNLTGSMRKLLPYTPHTTGKAGIYYTDRFRTLLPSPVRTDK